MVVDTVTHGFHDHCMLFADCVVSKNGKLPGNSPHVCHPIVGGWESTAGEDAPIEPHGPSDGDS